jgi:putative component of membrane protein insertase Oxa1/YidC/SpoIIIJ protein YidD
VPFSALPFPVSTVHVSGLHPSPFLLYPFPFPLSPFPKSPATKQIKKPAAPLNLIVSTHQNVLGEKKIRIYYQAFFSCLVFNNCLLSGHWFFILSCSVFYLMVVYSSDGVFNYSMFYSVFMFCLRIVWCAAGVIMFPSVFYLYSYDIIQNGLGRCRPSI